MTDLSRATIPELLLLQGDLNTELLRRGVVRTRASVGGELMERVVADAYSGMLAPPGTAAWDVVADTGARIQVKTRTIPRGDKRHFAFHSLDVDFAVVVHLDPADLSIVWAAELDQETLRALAKPHEQDCWRVRMHSARRDGTDVTQRLNEAYRRL